jgi:hypothetical protein
MTFNFTPFSDEELEAIDVVTDGTYDFEVIRSKKKMSKAGNDMAELNIKFWDKEGKIHTLFDYLVFSSVPLNIKKVKHFCGATGLHESYNQGKLPEELGGYSGKFILGSQDSQTNPNGGTYPKKNVVIDYIPIKKDETNAKKDANLPFSDDVPF